MITTPTSGTVVQDTAVEALHTAVRAELNDLTEDQLGLKTFNNEHFIGYKELAFIELVPELVTAGVVVNTTPAPFLDTGAAILATWQALAGYFMNGGGFGYTRPYDWEMWVFINLECTAYAAGSTETTLTAFAVEQSVNGVISAPRQSVGYFNGDQTVLAGFNFDGALEKTVTLFHRIILSAGDTVNHIRVRAANTSTNPKNLTIRTGVMALVIMPKGAP